MYRLLALGVVPCLLVAQEAQTDYARDVAPVLEKRCTGCHGAGQQMAGLRLDDIAAAIRHGAIVPGKASDSKLLERVSSTKKGFMMPPMGAPLSQAEIAALRTWIESGAKHSGVEGSKSSGPSHWAFKPLQRPAVPEVRKRDWVRNPIDAFVLARLEAEKLEPSSEAAKTTLIRRLSLDLIGLPPQPAEIAEFLADNRPDAYERLVDRLLASPHYGERWARPWLDLARYADSDGYEKDQSRPWAWRYRDWVINALNADMPFDRFTIEQIAGDLLPNATVEQRVATGFHRNVLTNREAGVDRAEARFEQNVNRTNTIGTTWLGLTVGCAQCHNHKYDTISQKEFYQLFAYVSDIEEADIPAPLPGEIGPYLQGKPEYDKKRAAILKEHKVLELQSAWEPKIRAAIENPGTNLEWDFSVTSAKAMVDNFVKLVTTEPSKRTEQQRDVLTNYFVRNIGPENTKDKPTADNLKQAREKLTKLDEEFPGLTHAMAVAVDNTSGKPYIAVGGDYRTRGADVTPGVLAVLGGQSVPDRLAFARWLVSKENPLTARVTVNRMWQEFFGRGLVRTSEDFGTQGEKPSHPELLDWLAAEFQDAGWSMKAMHKRIVMSAVYRQSSRVRKDLLSRDPDNALIARQGRLRLPAELVRDSALATAGLLNTKIGGKSIQPPQPAGVAELGYANSVKWVETQGPERYRRGLYIRFQRTTPYPMLMNFDAPNSNVACSRRTRSNTPLQALNLLNDPVFMEAAQGLALRIASEAKGGVGERIDYAFNMALSRKPTQTEKERLANYFDEQASLLRKSPATLLPVSVPGTDPVEASAWVGLSRVLLNLDEFITRE